MIAAFHRFFGLLLIAAVFNPVCCCYAGLLAADAKTDPSAHVCCGSGAPSAPASSSSASCPGKDDCPHAVRLVDSVAGHQAKAEWAQVENLVPVWLELPGWLGRALGDGTGIIPGATPEPSPPGSVSAFLRTHALLC